MHTKFWSVNLKGRDHWEDRRRWEDDIRNNLGEIGWKGVDWMDLAQGSDQWRAVVNMVMTLRLP